MADARIPSWPASVTEAAVARDLGSLVVWDKTDLRAFRGPMAALVTVLGVATLGAGVFFAIGDQRATGEWWHASLVLGLGLLVTVGGLVTLLRRGTPSWVGVFERGVVAKEPKTPPVALAWTEVEEVVRRDETVTLNGLKAGTRHTTVVRGPRGHLVIGTTYPAVVLLTEHIEDGTGAALLPGMIARLRLGGAVSFGPMAVDHRGLVHGTDALGWAAVASIEVHGADLLVREVGGRGYWARLPAIGFPNLRLFLVLTDSLCRSRPTQP